MTRATDATGPAVGSAGQAEANGAPRGPLHSVRILDFTENMAGPFGTMILGDQGADVIKVESLGGDIIRHTGTGSREMASYFANLNRSKRSLAIDLRRAEGRVILDALLDRADVFVHSFRPAAAESLGIDASTVTRGRPGLIYASIVGFGAEGPFAGRPVYDHVVQATAGMADLQRESPDDVPHLVRHGIVDKCTGHVLAQSVCAALIERLSTGKGTVLCISMLDVAVSFLWPDGLMNHTAIRPELQLPAAALTFRLTPTADGHVSVVVLKQAHWDALIAAFDLSSASGTLGGDEVPMTPGEILRAARLAIRHLPTDDVVRLLNSCDVPCAAVLSIEEMLAHPQIAANGTVIEYEHPLMGPIRQARATPRFPSMLDACVVPAPSLGEHTEQILAELGFDPPSIKGYINTEVVATRQAPPQ